MAQFVTHIIWISAPLSFHKRCHAKKDSRETGGKGEGLRGLKKSEAKRKKNERRGEKKESNVTGRRGLMKAGAVIWDV